MTDACGVLVYSESAATQTELRNILEKGDEAQKIEALKQAIALIVAGEKLPQLLMTIIRFVLTSKNHTIKKLLLIYWEVIDMVGPNGQLLPEMILVCNALRNDLIHPNEYVRGSTLRFLCKVKIAELLEPLVPSIIKNLEHRHSYVRRNAIISLENIFTKMPQLCPNAPELVFDLLENEEDAACRRNAIIMLFNCAQDKAVEYLNEILDQVSTMSDTQQFAIVDLIRKHTRQGVSDAQRAYYVKAIISLLSAPTPAVQFEAASALLELSPVPISAKAAASTFIELLCNQSDNNVKLVTLNKLQTIKKKHHKVLQELMMDILRALQSPTLDIRQKTLDFAMDLVNPRNIDGVVNLLKKEINKTQAEDADKGGEYRKILIKAIHSCALKFPDVAGSVVVALMDHIGDDNHASASYVASFVGEVVETYPEHRRSIVLKLIESLRDIKRRSVMRIALWIVGEYSESIEDLDAAFTDIKTLLGPPPFYFVQNDENQPENTQNKEETAKPAPKTVTTTKVLADGTYATQSALVPTESSSSFSTSKKLQFLRNEIVNGNFVLAAIVVNTLTKIALRLAITNASAVIKNAVTAEILLIAAALIQFADLPEHHKSPISVKASREEIVQAIKILLDPKPELVETMLKESREAHKCTLIEYHQTLDEEPANGKVIEVQPDDLLPIRLLQGSKHAQASIEDDLTLDLMKATGSNEQDNDAGELSKVYQLTGFSDPLYAECYINVHRFDIVLEVLVINRTKDTLQNVSLELSTVGDLKLAKRSLLQTHTIAPMGKVWIRSDIKVSSTETGNIYGTLVYDIAGTTSSDKNCVLLNTIRVDIIDYIRPAVCSDSQYRSMWYEFEWENKVPVNAKASSVFEFLSDIIKSTNMKCLTPQSAMKGDCRFLAANLYAKSIFGEDALANMSIEQLDSGEISGYIRIRSKTQGIALSLGDKIAQRSQN